VAPYLHITPSKGDLQMAGPQKTKDAATETKAPVAVKTYPVKLLKNYRPMGEDFKVLVPKDSEDEYSELVSRDPEGTLEKLTNGKITQVAVGDYAKILKGTTILVGKAEAQHVLKNRIAERSDDLFDG
jgi:hypothetical protein